MTSRSCWKTLAMLMLSAAALRSSAQPAYEATVVAAQAFALSGPGAGYYPTMALPIGSKVTVIGGKMGEWLPIAPPKGSFSWAPADAIEERADGVAVVSKDDLQIRVGSTLSDAHHVFQVQLKKGDRVQILDQTLLKDGGKTASWYKILPPKDELRYIAASQVQTPEAAGGDAVRSAQRPNLAVPPPASSMPATAVVQGRPIGNRLIPPAPHIEKTPTVSTAGRPIAEGEPPVRLTDDPSQPIAARLKNLRTHLELLRTRAPSQWDLDEVKKTLDDMLASTKDPQARKDVLAMRERVDHLSELKDRYDGAARRRDLTLQRDQELEELLQRKQRAIVGTSTRYHAKGVLTEAALAIDGKTTYAIQDDKGMVAQYVLPAPGLNIEPYVGKKVGLFGTTQRRSGMPPILTATQLAPIDETEGAPR